MKFLKKVLFCVFFLMTAQFEIFSIENQIDFSVAPALMREEYEKSANIVYRKAELDGTRFTFKHMMLFGQKAHFGFYNSFGFGFGNVWGKDFGSVWEIDVFSGPAFSAEVSKGIKVQGGPAIYLCWREKSGTQKSSKTEGAATTHYTSDYNHSYFNLGLGLNGEVKFFADKLCSLVTGLNFSYAPFCYYEKVSDGKGSYSFFEKYSRAAFVPYISFAINF